MSFLHVPIEQHLPEVDRYRQLFRAAYGTEPPTPAFSEFVYCNADPAEAESVARQYLSQYFLSVVKHYEFSSTHFGETKGYQAYDEGARMIREAGLDAAAEAYDAAQPRGTPDQMIEKLSQQRQVMGDLDVNLVFSYAGLPFDKVEESYKLLSKKVLPALKSLCRLACGSPPVVVNDTVGSSRGRSCRRATPSPSPWPWITVHPAVDAGRAPQVLAGIAAKGIVLANFDPEALAACTARVREVARAAGIQSPVPHLMTILLQTPHGSDRRRGCDPPHPVRTPRRRGPSGRARSRLRRRPPPGAAGTLMSGTVAVSPGVEKIQQLVISRAISGLRLG